MHVFDNHTSEKPDFEEQTVYMKKGKKLSPVKSLENSVCAFAPC